MMVSSEQALCRIRSNIFSYDGTTKEAQAGRVLHYLKRRVLRQRAAAPRRTGQWSGLTRAELARTGTCETDWF
ncbi:hypothetical protein D3C84_1171000 [compost metagenome]